MEYKPIEKYLAAEFLFMIGWSLQKIGDSLELNRKYISMYLKEYGYEIQGTGSNSDYPKEEVYKLGEELFVQGYSLTEISKTLKVGRIGFSLYLKGKGYDIQVKLPVPEAKQKEKAEKLKEVKRLFLNGSSLREITKTLKLNGSIVRDHLQELGYDTSVHSKKYSLKEDVFKKISTEEQAYWLGFLYADGYVRVYEWTLELTLKHEDYEHLVKFKAFLKTDAPIKEKPVKLDGQEHKAYRIVIHNKTLVQDLIRLGCIPNKSLVLKFPSDEIVPNSLKIHFIRGYMDGDGSITPLKRMSASVKIVGTRDFLNGMRTFMTLPESKLDKKGNAYSLQMSGYVSSFSFLYKMYESATIFLDRKMRKYNEIRSQAFIDEGQLDKLTFQFIKNEPIRNVACFYLALHCGMSTRTICQLNTSDLTYKKGKVFITVSKHDLTYEQELSREAAKYIQLYLDSREAQHEALFLSERVKGRRVSESLINTVFRKYNTNSTTLRKKFLLTLLKNEFQIRDIIKLCTDYEIHLKDYVETRHSG